MSTRVHSSLYFLLHLAREREEQTRAEITTVRT
jgi:hypothetical protein